jgi:pilus assembly protein CpaB
MRPVAVILISVAVVSSASAALLAKRWLEAQVPRPAVAEVASVEVLVAARDIAVGTPLKASDLRYDKWPPSLAGAKYMVRKDGADPAAKLVGQVTRRGLAEGEPLNPQATFSSGNAGMMAGLLTPGMRAVSIAISNSSAVSGFITPGDTVDVVLAGDFRKDNSGQGHSGPLVRFAAETVLESVKVLAIDQTLSRGQDGGAIQGKTATLEVTPKQAEVLTAAAMMGQLSLVLRSVGTAEAPPDGAPAAKPSPFTPDLEASRALKAVAGGASAPHHGGGGGGVSVNRGGQISTQGGGQ